MSTPTTKFVTTLLIVVLILSIVGIALIATLPRTPVTVTMPITVPSVSLVTISREVTVTAPAAGVATVTVTQPPRTVTTTIVTTVSGAAPAPAPKEIKIAFLIMGTGYPYWDDWIDGVATAVKELQTYGIPISYTLFDGKYDPKTQYDQILSAIGRYNVIILTPVDRVGLQPAIEEARRAGVLVIIADNAVERDDLMDPFIGSHNYEAAKVEALALIKGLRESGKTPPYRIFIIHGVTTAANNVLRLMGFRDALEPFVKNGTVKIVDVQCGYDSIDRGYSTALTVLAAQKFDGVLSTNDEMAIGSIRAIEASGLTPGKDVIVVGLNGIPQALDAIREGKMYATVSQAPFVMGYWSVYLAFWRLYFGFDPVKAAGGKNWIVTPTPLVTKENVNIIGSIVKFRAPLPLPNANTAAVKPVSDVMGLINELKSWK